MPDVIQNRFFSTPIRAFLRTPTLFFRVRVLRWWRQFWYRLCFRCFYTDEQRMRDDATLNLIRGRSGDIDFLKYEGVALRRDSIRTDQVSKLAMRLQVGRIDGPSESNYPNRDTDYTPRKIIWLHILSYAAAKGSLGIAYHAWRDSLWLSHATDDGLICCTECGGIMSFVATPMAKMGYMSCTRCNAPEEDFVELLMGYYYARER